MKRVLPFSLALLTGCIPAELAYIQPTGTELATLTGKFIRQSFQDWERYEVRGIDGLLIRRSMLEENAETVVRIAPGPRQIYVRFEYNRGRPASQFFRGPAEPTIAYYFLRARFEAGREYQVNGKVGAQFTELWIEEKSTGRAVSARVPCTPRPKNALTEAVCSKPAAEARPDRSNGL